MRQSKFLIAPCAISTAVGVLGLMGMTGKIAHAQSYTLSTLATFTGTAAINGGNGQYPLGNLALDSSGDLYGAAIRSNTVFELAAGASGAIGGSGIISTIATFNSSTGSQPYGGVTLDALGNIYGTTSGGSSSGYGTVFKIAAGSSTIQTLVAFHGGNDGQSPYSSVTLDAAGNLYGTTRLAGGSIYGNVFKIAAGTNAFSSVASFTGYPSGETPYAGVTFDAQGNLYGTTTAGGTTRNGTIFKIAAGTNTIQTLASFTGAGTSGSGSAPQATLTFDKFGNLYGTTYRGGTNDLGTVFKIAAGTNTLTTLVNFNGAGNGQYPAEGLTIDDNGNIFGTTAGVYVNNHGTVFEIAVGTNTLTTIASFNGLGNGEDPTSNLLLDSSGNLYGTTQGGGANNDGTIFKLTPNIAGAATPEPSALLLLVPGALGTIFARRRSAADRGNGGQQR